MSASASQIEREVEASRASVEETVEALKRKMSLGQMVDEAARYFGNSGGSQLAANLGAQVRDNPLPVALVGIGLVWLMSGRGQPHARSSGSRDGYGSAAHDDDASEYRRMAGVESSVYAGAAHSDYSAHSSGAEDTWGEGQTGSDGGDRGLGGGGAIRRGAHGIGGAVSGVAPGLSSAASEIGSAAARAAGSVAGTGKAAWRGGSSAYEGASRLGSGAYSGAARLGSRAQRSFSDVLETEPLVMGALGLAVGAAIGALLPSTEAEDRYLGEQRDRLREEAQNFAREKLRQGKAVAADAYETAKREMETQGLAGSGDSVLGRVRDVARATVERTRESAEEQGLTGAQNSGANETHPGSGARTGGDDQAGSQNYPGQSAGGFGEGRL